MSFEIYSFYMMNHKNEVSISNTSIVKTDRKKDRSTDRFTGHTYSPSRIVDITDALEFFKEYCEKKSETCTKFLTSLSYLKYKN